MNKENKIFFSNKTTYKIKTKHLFDIVFKHTLKCIKKDDSFYSISLSLVNQQEIKKLNQKYRNLDRPTDVLTFDYNGDTNIKNDLGSVIICPQVAEKQAKEFKHPLERELSFLFIHGILHAFGYDHMDEKDAKKMYKLQNNILNSLPIDFYTDLNKMKKLLLEAQKNSCATYSHFRVGAVVVTKDNQYHLGFNIENASYPATVCAERVALFSVYAKGYRKEDIVSLGCITDSKEVGTCCGVCRQVMSELMDLNCPVYIYNYDESKSLFTTVDGLLPYSFQKENME